MSSSDEIQKKASAKRQVLGLEPSTSFEAKETGHVMSIHVTGIYLAMLTAGEQTREGISMDKK